MFCMKINQCSVMFCDKSHYY
uniref:Uncharacterized protein n=1 Tax=Anguilla anguilla TaxID=7936 RepID=A0A0E9RYB0_ANGAN